MSRFQDRLKSITPFLQPRYLFAIGVLGIATLAVYGRFEHSPRWLHQVGWGFIAAGAFLWMAGTSPEEPNVWRGARKALLGYWILGAFLLYPILMSDGDFYYGVIRSMLWDRDVNTHNEAVRYAHGWLADQGPKGGPFGFPSHPFPIGASLSWIPFIAAGHAEVLVRRIWDPWLALDGYSKPYLNWLAVGTAAWGGVFVVFAYLVCRFRFSHGIALRALFGSLLATSAFYYCFRDAGFPHAQSMAAVAFFVWVWLSDPGRCDLPKVGLIAVTLSAAAMIRWQNCLFALAPIVYWTFIEARLSPLRNSPNQSFQPPTKCHSDDRRNLEGADALGFLPSVDRTGREPSQGKSMVIGRGLLASSLLGLLCLILCFPQLVFFRIRGPEWLSLEHGSGAWSWSSPKIFEMLFDPDYGIWAWHPFYFLAAIGGCIYLGLRLTRTGPKSPSKSRRVGLILLLVVALLEIYINASYVLWHGGGDYGNRLIVDLLIFFVLGFAGVLQIASERGWGWLGAALWLGAFGWSVSLLCKDDPKFTRTPRELTELFAHTTPAASLAQGIGHFDLPLILSGVWLFLSLGISLWLLFTVALAARRSFLASRGGAIRTLSSLFLASIACSIWFWIDLRHVDVALYLDDRTWHGGPGTNRQVDLVRQTFNSELVGWYPPGHENYLPRGARRMGLFLSDATPEFKSLLPVRWPEPGRTAPYVCERVVVLSRVHSPRPLPLGEPIARLRLERYAHPSVSEWTLLAGVDTDTPESLRLPPSSPDWYATDVSAIPRYFVANLPAHPTQEAEFLQISLIPKDVTLEVGAVWFSTSVPTGYSPPWDRPRFRTVPAYDRLLFDQGNYIPLEFPARLNPDVQDPARQLFPSPRGKGKADRTFRFFRDPWRLAGTVPVKLGIGDSDRTRPSSWHVLDWREPKLEIPIPDRKIVASHVAMVAGPIPKQWTGGPLAVLEMVDTGGGQLIREVFPGKDLSFWEEPYFPNRPSAWSEKRAFFPPIHAPVVSVAGFDRTATEKLVVRLTSEGIETGAQIAILGITLELPGD